MSKLNYTDLLAKFGIGGAHPGGLALTKQIFKQKNLNSNTSVLDVGCGTGQTISFLAKDYNCYVTGCDHHKTMIEKANIRFAEENVKAKAVHGKIEQLPFKNDSFDYVLSESVLAFSNLDQTLPEITRVLNNNGQLFLIEIIKEQQLTSYEEIKIKNFYGFKNILFESDWIAELKAVGFNHVEVLDDLHSKIDEQIEDVEIDFNPSQDIPGHLYDMLDQHYLLTAQFSHKIGYRVFQCKF